MYSVQKVIFLDFDGPLSNVRTTLQTGRHHAFDPVAVEGLSNICSASGARIVCTSIRTWADDRYNFLENKRLFEEAGLDIAMLHQDWTCRTDNGLREDHIRNWLAAHPEVTHYAILDDDIVDLPNFIKVTHFNGILFEHFDAVAKCLDFDIILAFNTARLNAFHQEGQFRLILDIFDEQYNDSVMRNDIA